MTGTIDFSNVEFQPWWLDLTGLSLLLVGLWIVRQATPPPKFDELPKPPIIPGTAAVTGPRLQADQ